MIHRRAVLASLFAVSLPRYLRADSYPGPMVEAVGDGLDRPMSFAFLPEGTLLITEKAGALRTIGGDRKLSEPIAGLPDVDAADQGGLLDIAIHPGFANTRLVFLSFTEPREGGMNAASVMRGRLSEDLRSITDVKVIFRQQTANTGGQQCGLRLAFDRGDALFLTTCDQNSPRALAREPDSHVGKIIRITEDGGSPPDNPRRDGWLPEIWSIGHGSVHGAAIHPETGLLWTVEHGAKGGDALNHPEAGRNYGWPAGSDGREHSHEAIGTALTEEGGIEPPVHRWDPSIGPSGMAFYSGDRYPEWKGNLFVGSLAQKHLMRIVFEGGKVVKEERLYQGRFGIRDLRQGPDGYLYMLTDESAPMGRVMRVTP